MNIPKITLKNGLRVANFSSPHNFIFQSGETLPGCSDERVKALSMERVVSSTTQLIYPDDCNNNFQGVVITNNSVSFKTTEQVRSEIKRIQGDKSIDICLIPFPMLTAMKEEGISIGKFRVVLLADRINKTIYDNKFSH